MLAHRFFIFLVAHCELVAVTLVISRDSGLQEFVQTFKDPKIVHVALDGLFWADASLGRPTKELFWADPRWVGPRGIHPEWPRRQDLDRHRARAAGSLLRQFEPRRPKWSRGHLSIDETQPDRLSPSRVFLPVASSFATP